MTVHNCPLKAGGRDNNLVVGRQKVLKIIAARTIRRGRITDVCCGVGKSHGCTRDDCPLGIRHCALNDGTILRMARQPKTEHSRKRAPSSD